MTGPRPEISAYFVNEVDARRTADALDAMFEQYTTLNGDAVNGRRWLLTIVLPDNPSLSTFYVDEKLLAMVEELVESNGGAVWDSTVDPSEAAEYDPDDEPGPEVISEMCSRLATPRSEWVTSTTQELTAAVERERRTHDNGSEANK
jgi:hypothetical protein